MWCERGLVQYSSRSDSIVSERLLELIGRDKKNRLNDGYTCLHF